MILNGAQVISSGAGASLYVSSDATTSTNNTLIVDGSGTMLSVSNNLLVGNNGGQNSMYVSGGALVNVRSNFSIGIVDTSDSNLVVVTGAGTIMNNNVLGGDSRVGGDGNAGDFNVMIITNNASVLTRNFYVGVGNGANSNLLIVTDGGTLWANKSGVSDRFAVGLRGLGNGAIVTNGGHIYVTVGTSTGTGVGASDQANTGGHSPSNNWMLVSGIGSTFSNAGVFTVGREGSGNWLLVNNGAGFTNMGTFTIGSITNAPAGPLSNYANSVTITDAGTVLSVGGQLTVGMDNQSNVLTVANGARLEVLGTGGMYIGNAAGDGLSGAHNNQVVITGAGTYFTNQSTLEIGSNGSFNSFILSGGAQMISGVGGNNRVRLGTGSLSSNNTMVVTGSGTVLQTPVTLVVGESGSGNLLTVADGAQMVVNSTTHVGAGGGSNTIVVTDAGSMLQTTSLQIGGSSAASQSGSNRVVVTAGGYLQVGSGGVAIGSGGFNGSNLLVVTGRRLGDE